MTLQTRKPTGRVAYPLLLLEGVEKAGKTYAALSLSKSERVGRTFILELDEPTADEYASLGDFEILEHNGTYSSIFDQLTEATNVPQVDGKPNVIIIDSGSALWNLLKDWASSRARNSTKNRNILAKDPDAEIDISMNLWNDAADRWYSVLNLLRKWPGIAIITARGREVAKVNNGVPVAGQVEWSTEVQKSTPFAVSAVLRMTLPHVATLMAVRSLNVDVPGRGLKLDVTNPVEHLIFDVLGAGGSFQVSSAVAGSVGKPVAEAKNEMVAMFSRGDRDEQEARKLASEVWAAAKLGAVKEVSDGQWKALVNATTERIVKETEKPKAKKATKATKEPSPAASPDAADAPEPDSEPEAAA